MVNAPDAANVRFSRERLERLAEIEGRHFWFAGRRVLVNRLLEKHLNGASRVLDLGCGTGNMVEALMERGYRAVGLDLRPEGLSATRRTRAGSDLLRADAVRLPLARDAFDAVLILDLLEHVDDRVLMEEVRRVLRPGGVVLATVPAIPWLWSYRDAAAGHCRRYTRRRLARLFDEAGFTVLEMRYYQCLLFPVLVLFRALGKKGPRLRDAEERPNRAVNAILTRVNVLEAKLGDYLPWPWGSTLVAVCRKG
jgi:SAM-dependent methyltransferase